MRFYSSILGAYKFNIRCVQSYLHLRLVPVKNLACNSWFLVQSETFIFPEFGGRADTNKVRPYIFIAISGDFFLARNSWFLALGSWFNQKRLFFLNLGAGIVLVNQLVQVIYILSNLSTQQRGKQ